MTEEEADEVVSQVAELCRGALDRVGGSTRLELMLRGDQVYDQWLAKGAEETAINVLHIAMQLLVRIAPKDKYEFDRIMAFFMHCFVRAYDAHKTGAVPSEWPQEI
jgi:hypothetical protein